ncbi:MAG: helix-turn-helix transcriptional regulator, partial [Candidatus Aenigmarchaeota archaeon]|nr:helix-turn-helix transcriptional regulator [Candidatus Aenigmarchaeota archaeon]
KQSTVSIQLGKLENAGILESKRKGRRIYYKIKDSRVIDILKIMKFEKACCCLCDTNEKNK